MIEFFHLSPKGIPSLSIINCKLSIELNPPFFRETIRDSPFVIFVKFPIAKTADCW